jgi:signal peptidase II
MRPPPTAGTAQTRDRSEPAPPASPITPATSRLRENPVAWIGLITAAITCGLDQAAKLWLIFAFDLGARGSVPVAPMLDLVLTWNTGISYGLFQQDGRAGRWLLLGFSLAAAVLLCVWLSRAGSRLTAVALGLIIGGALGNAIDRLAYGAVADFVFFHITAATWQFRWYIFNLADAAIVAGVIGLLYESAFPRRAAKAP